MAVKTTDTNPQVSTDKIKEILRLETEIDRFLLEHLRAGRASYLITVADRSLVDILMARYTKSGWTVCIGYAGEHLYRLEFEDPEQLDPTTKIKVIRDRVAAAPAEQKKKKNKQD